MADRPLGEPTNGHAAGEHAGGSAADWPQLAHAVQNAVRRTAL
jgi:hypothetical protein